MKVTVVGSRDGKPFKINFAIDDLFNEKAIRKETKKLMRERCPTVLQKPFTLTWKY